MATSEPLPVNGGMFSAELRALLDAAVDAIVVIDAEGLITTFNPAAERMFGYAAIDVLGRAVEMLMPEPYRSEHPGYLQRYLASGEARIIGIGREVQGRRANGDPFPIALSVGEARSASGRHFVGIIRDLTAQRAEEQRLRAIEARLEHVGRFNLLGEMAAGIAHEIRNPLASMSGSMQMLRHELLLSGDQAQLMDIVLRESERLNQTIKSFLAYARPQRLLVQALDLRMVVRETATLLRNSTDVGDRHTIEVQQSDREVIIDADEGQIRQIVWNLATNGLKAMPNGGTLTISAREEATGEGRMGVLRVEDEGVGIAAEDLDSIFQPFRGSFGKSTGLGLAIVHRLVTDYGGRIDVRPRGGRGTTFKVSFPAVGHGAIGRQAS
jgi:PAS domain S-box-containing protein